MKWKHECRRHWGNWTLGFWWGPIGQYNFRGLDLGPWQHTWKRRRHLW
jgi:hypothetical protein